MSEFLAMGGYGFYVWTAYAVSFAGIVGAVVLTLRAHAHARRAVAALESRSP